jgi:uncharacterized membrane-anchored protein/uncharacterized membrane protein
MLGRPADLLELPATRGRLHALTAAGVLDASQLAGALERLGARPSRSSWARYGYWHSLLIGVVLVVVGTLFFVAANWSALSGLQRMGLVGAAMVGATLVGGQLGETLAGRAVSLLGGLLFGPLLVVYSQVYQTGADAWQLFATWSGVLLAYAVLVRFVGTWLVVLVCVHTAWFAWMGQELGSMIFEGPHAWLVALLAVVDAGVVGLAERLLDGREREAVVHTAGVAGLAMVLPFGVASAIDHVPDGGWPGLVVLAAGLFGIWQVYRWRRPRLGMLVAFAVVVTILLGSALGRVVFEMMDLELFGVALLGVMVCGLVWVLTRWLLHWRHEHPPVVGPEPVAEPANPRHVRSWGRALVRPTLHELFAALAPEQLSASAQPRIAEVLRDEDGTDAPLVVRVFTAIGTWIGAAMVAAVFAAFEIDEVPPLALALAVGLIAGASVLSRRPSRTLVITQLIWAMALGAHGLLLGAALELGWDEVTIAGCWTALNLVLLGLIRVPSFELASVVCVIGFATWWASELSLPGYPLWVLVPTVGFALAAWLSEVGLAARLGRSWSPLAYGLTLGLLIPLAALSGDDAMLPIARHVPGLGLALVWLGVAHLRRSIELQVIALIQFGGFLLAFYYQLETSLLAKSLAVVATGVVLLLVAKIVRPHALDDSDRSTHARQSRWGPAIALTVLTVGLVAAGSARKQWILAHGQTVLLPLAPVDPRSLIQGDYMVLRYALDEQMGLSMVEPLPEIQRHGRLVIQVDVAGVGRFVRIDDGSPLGSDELRLEYRLRDGWDGRVRVGAESFLFEEGSAELYEGARFGELVVADNGDVVLVGLRDGDREPLGLRLH